MGTIYKPILFSTEMVQAILDGRKTQTRRIVKKKFSNTDLTIKTDKYGSRLIERQNDVPEPKRNDDGTTTHHLVSFVECKPKYQIGDILWVRETYANPPLTAFSVPFIYKADFDRTFCGWKPSIHMPKAAARIFLEVVNVRCERLHDISESDAIAEGVYQHSDYGSTGYRHYGKPEEALTDIDAVWSFETLWESINGKDSWKANPWVWVYEFKVIEKPSVWPQ